MTGKASDKKVLIIPPGLKKSCETFEDHYEVADGAPILILGPTGVGKTLYYEIYKKLFNDSHKKKKPAIRANCAHFGNQKSDPNIARSELFGIEKGVIQGVDRRDGLIKQADGGLLFLEEIGELPIAVQSMLLTFIEDGKFNKVGSTKEETSSCCIVAATNNEDALRDDFKNRFFPFHVPPVHEHRKDVLYYIYDRWPDLVLSLKSFEVLILLTYNWPGNVREIERIARLIKRYHKQEKRLDLDTQWKKEIFYAYRTHDLDFGGSVQHKDTNLYGEIEKLDASAEAAYLESLLSEYGVGFMGGVENIPFSGIKNDKPEYRIEEYPDIVIRKYEPYSLFEKAFEGYEIYCRLFFQDFMDDKNVLRDLTKCFAAPLLEPGKHFKVKDKPKLNRLMKKIFFFLSGIDLDKSFQWPRNYTELESFLKQQAKLHPQNIFLSQIGGDRNVSNSTTVKNIDEISTLTRKELLSIYYKRILDLSNGNVSAASRLGDIPDSTLRDELKKYNIK